MKQLLTSLICSFIVVAFALFALIFHYDECEKTLLSVSTSVTGIVRELTGESPAVKTEATISEAQLSAPKPAAKVVSGKGKQLSPSEDKNSAPTQNIGEEYYFDKEYYPYFHMLDASQQAVYKQIYANALKYESSFVLTQQISTSSLTEILSAVYHDHPELFWLNTGYSYGYYSEGVAVSLTLSFNETIDNIVMSKQKFENAISLIVEGAKACSNDAEKEKYVHDYLLKHVEYNEDAAIHQSAYSALVNHESVCAGYARAFQIVLRELGIPAYYCTGYTDGNHAWNIVKLDDEYYNVDVSWDDPVNNPDGTLFYDYFNVTDEQIGLDHQRTELSINLPKCVGEKYSYENYFDNSNRNPNVEPGFDKKTGPSDLEPPLK